MHNCPGMRGFSIPMVPAGQRADVRLVERGDYLAGEDVPLDGEGRPWMRAEVERPSGQVDVWVYAPTAYVTYQVGERERGTVHA